MSIAEFFSALARLALGNCWSFRDRPSTMLKLLSRKAAFISLWRPVDAEMSVTPARGRLSLADFDPLGQKLQEDADPERHEPTLPKIDSMQFVDVARIE